jgi:hypothetical protein
MEIAASLSLLAMTTGLCDYLGRHCERSEAISQFGDCCS